MFSGFSVFYAFSFFFFSFLFGNSQFVALYWILYVGNSIRIDSLYGLYVKWVDTEFSLRKYLKKM